MTKAVLAARVSELEAENAALRQQVLDAAAKPVPSAPKSNRVAIVADNPVLANLPRVTPFSKMVCPTHGTVTANKIGICATCSNERARAASLAA
jgi:hypothetical protein